MRLADGVELRLIAQRTPGFTGADLANALNEAALLAARHGKESIGMTELDEAVERLSLGQERKSRRLSLDERRATAYHEAGHAVCAAATPGAYPVSKISIIPRGFTGGVTRLVAPEDRISASRAELLAQLVVAYGGMSAEEVFLDDVTTGARNDIAQASDTARRMATEYGMSDRIGAINYGSTRPNPFGFGGVERDVPISNDTAREIDSEVRRILDDARNTSRRIVREHRDLIQEMADSLIEHEVIDGDSLGAFVARVRRVEPLATLREVIG
jgi:cell division protease FtsH